MTIEVDKLAELLVGGRTRELFFPWLIIGYIGSVQLLSLSKSRLSSPRLKVL